MDINSERVRRARVERGWTQQQLAEVADLSLRTVQRVENQSAASNETISSLCAVLELERQDLLGPDLDRPEIQREIKRARLILSAAMGLGAVLGSGLTLAVMFLLGGG